MPKRPTPQVLVPACGGCWHVPPQPPQHSPWLLPWKSHSPSWSSQSWHHPALLQAVRIPAETKDSTVSAGYSLVQKNAFTSPKGTARKTHRSLSVDCMLGPDCWLLWDQRWGSILLHSYSISKCLAQEAQDIMKHSYNNWFQVKNTVNHTVLLSEKVLTKSSVFCRSTSAMAIWPSTVFRSFFKFSIRFCKEV